MKFLENKTVDSKREMDIMDAIDEIKNLNKRHHTIPVTELLGKFLEDPLAGFNDDDMEAIEGLFSKKKVKRI
jgi:hypothetical protein